MMHPYKVFLFFLFATAITALFGVGVALPTGDLAMSMLSLGVTSVVTALCALAGGMGVTISTRATFSLMQTGRLIQWPAFMLSAWAGLSISSFILGAALTVTSGFLASAMIFGLAFGWGYFRKEIPWKGRTWLPAKMPKR